MGIFAFVQHKDSYNMEINGINVQPIMVDGVWFITKKQLCGVTGLSKTSIEKKNPVPPVRMPNGRVLYRADDVQKAVNAGKFLKYYRV